MFKKFLLTTSALALLAAAPVMAQTTSTPPAVSAKSNSSQIDASKLIGQSIQNSADNATIGKVDAVVLNGSGQTDKVIVGVGGFLGMGKKDVAIAWSDLQVTDNGKKVTMNTTKDALKAMPEYVWPKDQKHGAVYSTRATTPATSGTTGMPPATTGTDAPRR